MSEAIGIQMLLVAICSGFIGLALGGAWREKKKPQEESSRRDAEAQSVGNAAKLREAIEKIRRNLTMTYQSEEEERNLIVEAFNIAGSALAEPARNCDFHNTEHEARRAWFIEEVQPRLDGKRMDHKELPFSDWIFEKAKKGGAE